LFGSTGNWVLDIDFPPGSTTGYCCGESGSFWEISPEGLTKIETGLNGTMIGVSCPSIGNTYVCAGNSRLYLYDGNEFDQCCIMLTYVNGIHYYNDTIGWSAQVGGIGGLQGCWDYSCWWLQVNPDEDVVPHNAIHTPNGKDVWVVGWQGRIFHSPNGSDFYFKHPNLDNNTIWIQQGIGLTNEPLTSVYFTSATNGYACGANGILLKYTTLPGAPEGADILGIEIEGQVGKAIVDTENRTVHVEAPESTDITKIVPEIHASAGATIDPPSGVAQDFTSPMTYTITSSNGQIVKTWTVYVTKDSWIEEQEQDHIHLWPNPTNGKFHITGTKFQTNPKSQNSISKLEVVDIYGKVVYISTANRIPQTAHLNISHLPAGIYFVRILIDNQSIVKKIIKL
jgi:hypothetical protein